MKGPDDKPSVPEGIQLLKNCRKEYSVRRAVFHDVSFGTFMMFELKKTSKMNRLIDGNDCHTIQDIIQILEKAYAENAVRKIDIHETGLGNISINLCVNSIMEVTQSGQYKIHTIQEARELPERFPDTSAGSKSVYYDSSFGKTRMHVRLDEDRCWILSIYFMNESGNLQKYSLDYYGISESYYEFRDEASIRKILYRDGDENKYLDEIFAQYIRDHSGTKLLEAINPYITAQYHYD